MNAKRACAQVIDLASHPAVRARAVQLRPAAPAAEPAPRLSDEAAIRVAARIARRRALAQPADRQVRVLRFRSWFSFFRLWRRWRLGLPLSRHWRAPATLSPPSTFPGGVVCQFKRSPRAAGVRRWRDFCSAVLSRGRRVLTR